MDCALQKGLPFPEMFCWKRSVKRVTPFIKYGYIGTKSLPKTLFQKGSFQCWKGLRKSSLVISPTHKLWWKQLLVFFTAMQPSCVLASRSQSSCALMSSCLHHLLQKVQKNLLGARGEGREDLQKEKSLFISVRRPITKAQMIFCAF